MGKPIGPLPTPPGLSPDWPAPWEPLEGADDGLLRHVELALMRGGLAVLSRLPQRVLDPLLSGVARTAKRVDRRHTAAARVFLRQALGDLPEPELERRVTQAYRHLLRVVVDSERLARRVPIERIREHFDLHWTPEAEAVRDSESGKVVVTAHLGSWEAGAAILPWIGFDPAYVVAKPPKSAPLARAMQESRERNGVRVLPRRGAMQAAPAIVRAGGTICMLLDQRARKRPVLAPFFGRPARCDRSAGVLIRRLRVPVIIGSCTMLPEPLRYRAEFLDVLQPEELAGAAPEEIATHINRSIEAAIRRVPEQYFWLHDRYRDTPESFDEPVKELPAAPRDDSQVDSPAQEGRRDAGLRTRDAVSSNADEVPANEGDPQ